MFDPVLVLGAEPRIAISIARSLNRHGIKVDIAALSSGDVRLSSRALRKFIYLTDHKGGPNDLIGCLTRLIKSSHYGMLIPCSDTALIEVVRHYDRLKSMVHICSPQPEIIQRVLDKSNTLKFAQGCGVPIPATYHIPNITELRTLRRKMRYPMIAKPLSKQGAERFKILYFNNFTEIENAFSVDPQFGSNTLFQEYSFGEGVGIGTYIQEGRPLAIFQHRRLKEYPSAGGVSVLAISEEPDPLLVRYSTRLLNVIGWQGVALVEFRFNRKDRTATLMEINGRYWGSLASAIHAGVDFPFIEWQIANQKKVNVPMRYRTGLRVRWVAGDCRRLHQLLSPPTSNLITHHSRWAEVIRFVTDFRPSVRNMLLAASDPVPAIIEISHVCKSLLLSDAKTVIKSIIPLRTLTFMKTLRLLEASEKIGYSLYRLGGYVSPPKIRASKSSAETFRIVFLCHGNIIRSPMAEALFKREAFSVGLKNFHVMSAGIYAKPGVGADPRSVAVAKEFGIRLNGHHAQPITNETVEKADAVFVMDSLNEAGLLAKHPKTWKKLYMLGSFFKGSQTKSDEIEDPYSGDIGDVRRCYKTIQAAVDQLVADLAGSTRQGINQGKQ